MSRMDDRMQNIVSLAKRRGFIFQSSEIYGGVEALWDYGPLGALLKNNIKKEWLKRFVQKSENIALIDAAIIMHPKVWEASGHLENFTDPLVECLECNARYRADHMEEGKFIGGKAKEANQCSQCGGKKFTEPRSFNLMFKTFLGPLEDASHAAYLRPETAQAMFTNFKLVQDSQRLKIPFGIAQIGKAFRNEITTGNFIFRSREFEQVEIEYFVKPGEDEQAFDEWLEKWHKFFIAMGLDEKKLRLYEHPKEKLSHYSKRTVDIEYEFPFGWGELAGVANRTDFDLKRHSEFSKKDLSYFNAATGEKYIPYVIEPTLGVDRLALALLCDAYEEIEGGRTITTESIKEKETVLRLKKFLAPYQVAILPLVKNKPEITAKAREVYSLLNEFFSCQYDETGSIGKRYRRQDEIGTPLAVTIDFDSIANNDVTLRDRDTMKQDRLSVDDLIETIKDRLYV
ncbi:MAG: glycine--tRNA ligase [Candidatus Wildermuthbacteria bacterium]|nr:glycine--tRNA ligase [Candidatus Wildermuthbacteria bacterium]